MDDLIQAARVARDRAYVPYSECRVGAALETDDGTIFTGCNIENPNFSNSLHAEEVAVARAVLAGHRAYNAIAVSSDEGDGVTPCGMCRQTLIEFCAPTLPIRCDEGDSVAEYTLGELLPASTSTGSIEG